MRSYVERNEMLSRKKYMAGWAGEGPLRDSRDNKNPQIFWEREHWEQAKWQECTNE